MEKMESHTSKNQEFWTLLGANGGAYGLTLAATELCGRYPQVMQALDRLPSPVVLFGVPLWGCYRRDIRFFGRQGKFLE